MLDALRAGVPVDAAAVAAEVARLRTAGNNAVANDLERAGRLQDGGDDDEIALGAAIGRAESRLEELQRIEKIQADRNEPEQLVEGYARAMGVGDMMPSERPKRFACPISHETMVDPVIDALGFAERQEITQWLRCPQY